MIKKVEMDFDGRVLTIETGRLGRQADGAVLVSMGGTLVFSTATMSKNAREGVDFFPLMCDYEERKYAVGKIPGGFVKRGGRPSDRAVLVSRLIDRPIRPMFPDGIRHEVQVIAMPLSVDLSNPPDVLAMLAASASLSISKIPFEGPIGALRVSQVDGRLVANPTWEETEASDMNIIIAGTRDAVTTIDVEAAEVSEERILEAVEFGRERIGKLIDLQEELMKAVGTVKQDVERHKVPEEIVEGVKTRFGEQIGDTMSKPGKTDRVEGLRQLKDSAVEALAEEYPGSEVMIAEAVEKIAKAKMRKNIMEDGLRPDGRKPEDIREISSEVGLLPRVHGSGLFTRGQTQVLTTVTLGSVEDAQIIDNIEVDTTKRYMHYYNFPPYSVGETRPMRGPGRREVGHGALAEKALQPVIPSQDEFPYALLLTSEVMESNGSTSMAATCGSTLALMDAGVPIKTPVAGAAMGLITDGDKFVILNDLMDFEDFYGDMDFKVAGTENGVTAVQLDTKIKGINVEIMRETFRRAKEARMYIMGRMLEAIPQPREDLSEYAPRVLMIEIHPDKIGEVIGPGGKVIKKIEAETGADISIEQDGRVFITAVNKEGGERAYKMVDDITREVRVGETYLGKVVKIAPFGAFVEILPGRDGLVHISQLSPHRVEKTEDVVKLGEEVVVKVTEINPQGKISLTRKGVPQPGEKGYGEDADQSKDDEALGASFRPKR